MLKIKEYIEKNFDEIEKNIFEVVKIPSIKGETKNKAPFGIEVKKALIKTLEIAEKLGFKIVNLDNYIGYAQMGEGEEYIAILGHLDVVDIGDIDNWSITAPFSPIKKDGKLYGRGILDNKAPIISSLYSVKYLFDTIPNFNKKIRVIFGTNEESGDEDIKYYLSKEKPPKFAFTPDGRFPVIFSERGIFQLSFSKNLESQNILTISGGDSLNTIPDTTMVNLKNNIDFDITDTKIKYSDNKISIIGRRGHTIKKELAINSNEKTITFLENSPLKEDKIAKELTIFNKEFNSIFAKYEKNMKNFQLGKAIFSKNTLKYDGKNLEITIDIRYPQNFEIENFFREIKDTLGFWEIKFLKNSPPLYFPKNSILVETLSKVYNKITKREEEPCFISGGTYARLMPNTVAFGPNFKEFNGNPHSYDENIDISMLKLGIEIYSNGIYELSKFL